MDPWFGWCGFSREATDGLAVDLVDITDSHSDDPRAVLPLGRNACGQGLTLSALAMLGIGVVAVNSALASVSQPGVWYARVDVRHGVFAALAVVVLLTAWRIPYRWLSRGRILPWAATIFLGVAIVLGVLVFVPGVGHEVGGKYRWVRIGPRAYSLGLQPSEFIKIFLILFLAAFLTRETINPRRGWVVLFCLALVGLCTGLVITQDFGTGLLIGSTALVTMFIAGVPWYYLVPLIPAAGGAGYLFVMSNPQKLARVMAMIDPWNSENPSSYQAQQSILSIFSGGWTGRGLGEGLRKLGFLPEDSTDFIFASFCEEWGFRGAVLVVGLLLLWLWYTRRATRHTTEPFGRALVASLGAMLALQAILHIGVNIVILPPTGVAMPFVSAGGTSLVLMAGATALMVSVTSRAWHDEGLE
jgi:cell division protein FtsW